MARSADHAKILSWEQRLKRYSKSKLTVAEFCAREAVSVPSFYSWRKRLSVGSSRRSSRHVVKASPFRAVTVVPATPALSVELPGGARMEVGTTDLEVVRAVVAELIRDDHVQEDTSC